MGYGKMRYLDAQGNRDGYCPRARIDLELRRAISWSMMCSFFEMMGKMVVKLHAHFRDFFRQIVSEGGTVMLIVNLPGKRNQGDTLAPELLGKMADMSVSLGVETLRDKPTGF
jgi:hypothetical protein